MQLLNSPYCTTAISGKVLKASSFFIFRLDVYRKVPKDLTEPTYTGAISKFFRFTCVSNTCRYSYSGVTL